MGCTRLETLGYELARNYDFMWVFRGVFVTLKTGHSHVSVYFSNRLSYMCMAGHLNICMVSIIRLKYGYI